jgi:hypothetical protein
MKNVILLSPHKSNKNVSKQPGRPVGGCVKRLQGMLSPLEPKGAVHLSDPDEMPQELERLFFR